MQSTRWIGSCIPAVHKLVTKAALIVCQYNIRCTISYHSNSWASCCIFQGRASALSCLRAPIDADDDDDDDDERWQSYVVEPGQRETVDQRLVQQAGVQVSAGRAVAAGRGQKVGVSQRPRLAPPPSRAAPGIPRQPRQPAAAPPPRKASWLHTLRGGSSFTFSASMLLVGQYPLQ